MSERGDDLDRMVLDGIRDSGLALLHEDLAAGAEQASRTLARALGAVDARVVLLEGGGPVGPLSGAMAGGDSPLDRFLREALTPERIAEWNRKGTDAEPSIISIGTDPLSPAARDLRKAGIVSVLLVPLPGLTVVRGVMGAALPEGSTPDRRRLEVAAMIGQLSGIGIDVLARALAAEETEEQLRRFIGQLPDPALLLDAFGTVQDASEMVEPLFGLPAQALIGRPLGEILEENDRDRLAEALMEAMNSGATRTILAVAGRRRGEVQRIELNVRRFGERRLLAVARNVTLQVRREHSLRVLLRHAPGMMSSKSPDELWERLSNAIKELLPSATYVWVYRGESDCVRMVWSSNPEAPPWEFRLRGWGTDVSGMLRQEDLRGEFLRRYGSNERMARETLSAILEGHGTPMLLDHPTEQLAIYLSERELEQILAMWGDSPPGQLIHCPVIVKGHMELLVVVDAPPGERPFVPEDATFVWQLTNLVHQALGRIEGFELARRQLGELETFLEAVRQVGEARGGDELLEVLVRRVMDGLEADRARLFLLDESGWRCLFSFGEGSPGGDAPVAVPRLPEDGSGNPRPLYLPEAGKDQAWRLLAGEDMRSLVALPLVSMGRFQGALLLASAHPWEFTAAQRQLAEFFADEIALVTAQVRLGRAVAEANAALHGVMDAVQAGIVLCDPETRLVRVNRSAASLLRLPWPVPPGRSVIELFPSEARENLARALERTLDRGTLGTVVLRTQGRLLRVVLHPRVEGGAILVIEEGRTVGGPEALSGASEEDLRRRAELGRIAVEWERVEERASHLNDLLTALSGQIELAGRRSDTVPESALRLAEEACRTGMELGTLLGAARPDRRGGPGGPKEDPEDH